MDTAAIFSSPRRQRLPSLEAFLVPVDLTDAALIQTLTSLSNELLSRFSVNSMFFQRVNSRSLIRKIEVFVILFECLMDSGSATRLSSTAVVCLNELYLLLYRSKILLDYCTRSSKLWLLLQNQMVSGHFHDLNKEISTLLDVFPLNDIELSDDAREQIQLVQRQVRRARLYIDKKDEALRVRLFLLLDEFENERIPNSKELRSFFIESLGITDAKGCNAEIEFLEKQIVNHKGEVEPAASVINGFVAITRYARFLLFGFEENEAGMQTADQKKVRKGLGTEEMEESFITVPRDFCCPITLELMRDPVIISTGQTYERSSIDRWIMEGNSTCPKTGQGLMNTRLVPNQALRNLIMQWSIAHGIPYGSSENMDATAESFAVTLPTKAAKEATKVTATLLIHQLASGSQGSMPVAAQEIRLLAKIGNQNRALIAEAGAIPCLHKLLLSPNPMVQENCVTAILNLSIYDKNKSRIMDEEGCLTSIANAIRLGITTETRENAAATLFSLSSVHEYKKIIADEEEAVEALAGLLRQGTPQGMKDAVSALFNLSTHAENCSRMIEAGAISALVGALETEGIAEDAAGTLALIVRQPIGAEAVCREEMSVTSLIEMMQRGTPRGKENAVAALLELCRSGGAAATERVLQAPALASLLHSLLFTGTKRARRKAASLARVFQRCKKNTLPSGGNTAANREMSFASDVSMPMAIPVPVL